jgi:hypothetical protein
MRTRSILFLALGALAASTLPRTTTRDVRLFVPENGFISLNVPLTARRIGTLSTRTTHPRMISLLQGVFDQVGIPVKIENPYQFRTKGELLAECRDRDLLTRLISTTVSCGKWRRKWQQCGRCVPCLIRRAALRRAEIADLTDYQFRSVREASSDDDVESVRRAVARWRQVGVQGMTRRSVIPPERAVEYEDVFRRGMLELSEFLSDAFA